MPKDKKPRKGPRAGGLRGLLDGLGGARLCYGEPVVSGERAVIPVARVRVAGGGGFGAGGDGDEGGGGGGYLEASPQGFIEVGPEGARYQPIPDPERLGRALRAAAGAAATLATGMAVAKRLRRAGGSSRAMIGRGR
jgi:uncharacterized spore protein YtfJ